MKKTLSVMLALTMGCSLLTGCSGGSSSGDKEAAAPVQAQEQSREETKKQEEAAEGKAEADTPAAEEKTASGPLVLYSPANDEEYNMIVDAFMEKYPDVEIEVVQGGSGELKTRLDSEKNNPQADVMFGGLTQADAVAYEELWDQYVSPYDKDIAPAYQNTSGYVTMKSINLQILLVNNELAKEAGVEITSLNDLLKPELKGKIAMIDPSSSATAYRWLTCILYVIGEGDPESDQAWGYVEQLIQNLDGKIATSSSVAHKSVFEGEYVVGLTSESNGLSYLTDGFGDQVTVVYPAEGTTAASYGAAMIKNCKNRDNAETFIDFLVSGDGQAIYADSSFRPANTSFKNSNEYLPNIDSIKLTAEDYSYISANQQAILDHFNELWAKYN